MTTATDAVFQAAVIPVRTERTCLVMSSSGKRWIVPKGCIEGGRTAGETALREAWEEAGLVGILDPEPVGSYVYRKYGSMHHVTVFVLRVTEVHDDYPEQDWRLRRWFDAEDTMARIQEPGLRRLLGSVLALDGWDWAADAVASSESD